MKAASHGVWQFCLLVLVFLSGGCVYDPDSSSKHWRWKTMDDVTPAEQEEWKHPRVIYPDEESRRQRR